MQELLGGLFMVFIVLLFVCGYLVLAAETALYLLRRLQRSGFFSGFAAIGMSLAAVFIFVGLVVGTNSQLFVLKAAFGAFVILMPPFRLVRILGEEYKPGTEEGRLLYTLSLALNSIPSFFGAIEALSSIFRWIGYLLLSLGIKF
jgi:hypothetical protein